jgi:aromatic-amino-acid transaminase
MFERLQPQAQDSILALMQMFRDDPRRDKIDLGIGVYRDASGRTPVMQAVRTAGRQLLDSETTKTYIGLAGDPAFAEAMRRLVLGDDWPADRTAAIATPGGTGALRQAFELVRMAASQATVWLPDPTWPNHLAILHHLRVPVATYRYFDAETRGVDVGGMTADLARVRPGDVVVLHGCCHNPTGADPTLPDWADLARRLADRGALPLIDLAYQGFGEGLEADAAASRLIAATCPEVLVAASCSKSFGIYRERTGLLLALGPPARMSTLQANLDTLNRHNYSFPPDHGARLVTTILTDPDLRAGWTAELEATRQNIPR